MEFSNPEREVAAYSLDEVIAVLEQAESAAREGYWSVGFVTYDAAPAFNRACGSVCFVNDSKCPHSLGRPEWMPLRTPSPRGSRR